jgi:MtN3 and saliva related transmembrane protein
MTLLGYIPMTLTTWIGITASTFTSLALIPQLIKLIREKKAGNLSIGMLAILFTGLALWIYYGILKHDWIIIVSNGLALVINLATGILTLWLHDHEKKRPRNTPRNIPRKSHSYEDYTQNGD